MRFKRLRDECNLILDSLPDVLISWKSFFWTIPVSLISTVVINPVNINSQGDLVKWIVIVLGGHLAMIPFVIYGKDKTESRQQIYLVILMGITRGSIVGLFIPLLDVSDPLSISFRIINSTFGVFYWFIVGSILLQFMVDFRKDMKDLIEETLLSNATLELPEHYVDSNILLSRLSTLQKEISKTLEGTPTREKLKKSAREIDVLVKEHIRPLSHSEWREGELVWLKAGFFRIIATTLRQRQLPFLGIIVLTIPYSVLGQVYRFGVLRTITTQVIWFGLMLLIRHILTLNIPPRNGSYLAQNLSLIAGAFLCATPIVFIIHNSWPGNVLSPQDLIQLQLARTLSFAILCVVTAMCIALISEEKSAFRIISEQIKEKNPQDILEQGIKSKAEINYAQYLHAEVQSQLLACKLLLLKSAESDFTLFPPDVTKQILERLEKIKQPYAPVESKLPSIRIQELSASWKGLANITFSLVPEIEDPSAPHDVIAQLIEEAIINSIRHGKAQNVHITATTYESLFAFEIRDDGASDFYGKGSGLGTILFKTFSKDWSISRDHNQTVVRFSIPRLLPS